MMLLTFIEAANIEVKDDRLLIEFDPKATEYYKKSATKESRQFIADAAREVFGREMKIDVKLTGSEPSEVDTRTDTEKGDEQLRKQVENDPSVQLFVKTFKGEVTKIEKDKE